MESEKGGKKNGLKNKKEKVKKTRKKVIKIISGIGAQEYEPSCSVCKQCN